MLYTLRIKLTSPFLGNKRTPKLLRCFVRKKDEFAVDLAQWNWTIEEAAKSLHMEGIDFDSIRFPVSIPMPTVVRYVRSYHHQRTGELQEEMFESFREGLVLTIEVMITSVPESAHKRAPTADEVRQMLELAGRLCGWSPFGGRFGFGRFVVLEFAEK